MTDHPDRLTGKPWPATPLDAAQRAFDLLTCPPAPLAFDCRGFVGLPQRILPLDELKTVLIDDDTPRPVRDAVWRELVIRARRDGPAWVVAAAGIAMPGLRRMAGMLAKGWYGDSSDRDAELLTGFVDRLRTIDLTESRIVGKLIDAGARAVKLAREREEEVDTIRVRATWSLPPQHPWDHPDWVLARAVAAAVIGPEEHLLISATRLGQLPLQVVADHLRILVGQAGQWRRTAERRLVEAVQSGELDWDALVTAATRKATRMAANGACAAAPTATVRNGASSVAGTGAGRRARAANPRDGTPRRTRAALARAPS
jgi:hypothetical protein